MCKAHDSILGGHNATLKTYLKISTSYYWMKTFQDFKKNAKFCIRCQQQKKSTDKKMPLSPLLIPKIPNIRIKADLFGPMIMADSNNKMCCASQML
jgi:hypothetical protein